MWYNPLKLRLYAPKTRSVPKKNKRKLNFEYFEIFELQNGKKIVVILNRIRLLKFLMNIYVQKAWILKQQRKLKRM